MCTYVLRRICVDNWHADWHTIYSRMKFSVDNDNQQQCNLLTLVCVHWQLVEQCNVHALHSFMPTGSQQGWTKCWQLLNTRNRAMFWHWFLLTHGLTIKNRATCWHWYTLTVETQQSNAMCWHVDQLSMPKCWQWLVLTCKNQQHTLCLKGPSWPSYKSLVKISRRQELTTCSTE